MRSACGVRMFRRPLRTNGRFIREKLLVREQRQQRNATEACAAMAQEIAAVQQPPTGVGNGVVLHSSEHVNKFVRIQQRATKNRKALFSNQFYGSVYLCVIRVALKGEGERAPHLGIHFLARFRLEPSREERGLLHHESTVQ